ncbi:MAG: type II toxin-antitoxin system death-on-curing family toxin [Acidobacteria bacterium]|nr:type II toxin-antitoxin system death-on-curing family toxin [Acidobacteriota bacterium]
MFYLSVDQALHIHRLQTGVYGGAASLRDRGGLESAMGRPSTTFGGEDLYPDVASKAAALMHSLVLNHPFVDGNKRVGAHVAIVFVEANGWEFLATPDALVDITVGVARGDVEIGALTIWFRQRIRSGE